MDLLGPEDEGLELLGEDDERLGEEGKVVDKDAKNPYSAKESSNVRKIVTGTPIRYFHNVALIGYPALWGTTMTDDGKFFGTQNRLGS